MVHEGHNRKFIVRVTIAGGPEESRFCKTADPAEGQYVLIRTGVTVNEHRDIWSRFKVVSVVAHSDRSVYHLVEVPRVCRTDPGVALER